jgi:hypothetical protein
MNRREFLATLGVGALSLAGKNPPPKPSFVVEIETDSSAIWVNGKRPIKAWSHDEGLSRLDADLKDLVVDGVTIDSIKANTNSCDCEQVVGTEVTMATSKGTFKGKITKIVDQSWAANGDVKPIKIKLYNGEELSLDSGKRYFRIDF